MMSWIQQVPNEQVSSISSVIQSCPTLCYPMDCSTPGFPLLYHLPELVQTHIHWVSDAIQTSHPLLSLSFLPSIFPSIRVISNELALCISSVAQSCLIICDSMNCDTPGLPVHHQTRGPRKPIAIESVMLSSHLILCHLLLLLPSIFHSIWVFSNESAIRMRWPKYCSFNFSIRRP